MENKQIHIFSVLLLKKTPDTKNKKAKVVTELARGGDLMESLQLHRNGFQDVCVNLPWRSTVVENPTDRWRKTRKSMPKSSFWTLPEVGCKKNRCQWNICMLCLAFFQVSPAFTCGVWQCRMYPWRTCHQDAGFVSLKRIQVLWLWKELTWIGTRNFIVSPLAICHSKSIRLLFIEDDGQWQHRFLEGQTWTCEWETMNKKKRVLHKHTWAGNKTDYRFFHLSGTKSNLLQKSHSSLPSKWESLPGESGRSWTGRCLVDGSSYWSGQFSSFAYCLYRSLICLDLGIMTCTRIDLRRTASDYSTT